MSIKKFIEQARRNFPEVDEYFRLRPELVAALTNEAVGIERIFNVVPSLEELLKKYGLTGLSVKDNTDQLIQSSNESMRLLSQVFGYPWKISVPEKVLKSELNEPNAKGDSSFCGDCDCEEPCEGERIHVVTTPDGDLAYGVSDDPLTIEEEAEFFDNLRKSVDLVKKSEKREQVNHPDHYRSHPSGIECIELAEKMSFNLGNAFKYVYRRNDKENSYQDLRKAEFYIKREIERMEKLLEDIPGSFYPALHPGLSLADLRKAERIYDTEPNPIAAKFYSNLFSQGPLQDPEELGVLWDALDALHDLMDEVRREQDEKLEKEPLDGQGRLEGID